jgi:choline-sulfatase
LYEEMVRVPLVLAGPGIDARRVETAVSAIDLMPTLADVMGVSPVGSWRGESLRGHWESSEAVAGRPCMAQGTYLYCDEPLQMVVDGGYKLIHGVATGRNALYDLGVDPGEEDDIAGAHPEVVARLEGLLGAMDEVVVSGRGIASGDDALDAAREALEAQGYL